MIGARTLLAVLIAISVVFAPVTGGAGVSITPVNVAMPNNADMPCCPSPDDRNGSVACAFKCLNFVATIFPLTVALPYIAEGLQPAATDGALHGHVSPPTHPPPI